MDCGHVVLALSNDRESFGVLEPGLFEVAVKNGFTLSVENASGDNVSFDTSTLSHEDKVLDLLDDAEFSGGLSGLVVLLGERVVQVTSPDLLLLEQRLVSILGALVSNLG